MKILFTNPPSIVGDKAYARTGARWPAKKVKHHGAKDLGRYTPFPFFTAYASALLRQEGHNVSIIDASTMLLPEKEYSKEIKERSPELVVVETSAPTHKIDLNYAHEIKKITGAKILFVGPHASVYPMEFLKDKNIDYVAFGEYEFTTLDLANELDKKSPNLSKIKGLAYTSKGNIKLNEKRPDIDPLDQLPFPDRDSFPIDSNPNLALYWDGFCEIHPAIQMVATRGCPFNCNFCLWTQTVYPGRRYRCFSAERVVDEMELVQEKYGARMIYFDDDTITADRNNMIKLCAEMKSRGLDIPWSVMGDAMAGTRDMLKAMSEAGCISIKFGVESADPYVLKRIDKPVRPEKVMQFAKWCREFKLRSHATFSFGLTGDTMESMEKTLRFACKLDVDSVQFSINIPYPGTRFYNEAKKNGWLLTEDWSTYDGRAIVSYPNLSAEQIQDFFNKAHVRWRSAKIRDLKWLIRRAERTYRYRGVPGLNFLFKRGFNHIQQEALVGLSAMSI